MKTQHLRILIVEDDIVDRMTISKTLRSCDFSTELYFAEDAEDAIVQVSANAFDCVFLDYNLPGSDGISALKEISNQSPDSLIIIMTTHGVIHNAVDAMRNGAHDYMTKDEIQKDRCMQKLVSVYQAREQRLKKQQLERKLKETQDQLQTVINTSPIVLFSLNKDGHFILFDGKGIAPLGFQSSDIVGKHISFLSTTVPMAESLYLKGLAGESGNVVVHAGEFYFEIFYSPTYDEFDRVKGVTGVATDVTNLTRAKKMAEEAAEMKQHFIANMSHEIRTPMHAIISMSGMMLKTSLSNEQEFYAAQIQKSSSNLLVIINDILDFSKADLGKMTFERTAFGLSDISMQTIELFSNQALEKSLSLSIEVDPMIPAAVVGDPTRLTQILNNLINNAIKFTEKGSIKVRLMTKKLQHDQVVVGFEVTDTGIGIPKQSIEQIFDSFKQASNDTTRKFGGTGLGLSIVKRLVELQGGKIFVRSTPGKGSSFFFDITYDITDESKLLRPSVSEVDSISLDGMRILVAEDNNVNQFIAKKLLGDWGVEVHLAENGRIALEHLRENQYDIVLMDIQMPEMSGYEATELIRKDICERIRNTPVMAMTAHATQSEMERCIVSGMNGYISKPYSPETLKKTIHALTKQEQSSYTEASATKNEAGIFNMPQLQIPNSGNQAWGYDGPMLLQRPSPGKDSQSSARSLPINTGCRINLSYLKQISDGNDEFIIEMIEIFLNKTPLALEEMNEHFKQRNWEELRQIAHRIKPSFTYIGLHDIQKALGEIERLTLDTPEEPKNVDVLLTQVQNVSNSIFSQLRYELESMR